MSKGPAQVEREAVMNYLTSRWTRTKIAAFGQGVTVDDPGHGKDEVCPVVYWEQPFDPNSSEDLLEISVYAAEHISGYALLQLEILDGTWIGQTLRLTLVEEQWILAVVGGDVVVIPAADPIAGDTVSFKVDATGGETFTADVTNTWLHGVGYLVVNLEEMSAGATDVGSSRGVEALVQVSVLIASPPETSPLTPDQYSAAVAMMFRGFVWERDGTAAPGTPEREMFDAGVHNIYQDTREAMQERANHIASMPPWQWYLMKFVIRRLYEAPRVGATSVIAA